MNIMLAPDSFKGSLTAVEAAKAMAAGIKEVDPSIYTFQLPLADGGEGTMENLVRATNGTILKHKVENPLGELIQAGYGVLGDEKTCVIELAEASGLMLIDETDKNPLFASTYGTGQLIKHALDAGFRKFVIGLGGSATNDGGAGILQALGLKLLDSDGQDIPKGGDALQYLDHIDVSHFDSRIQESFFTIANDVDNPFVGLNGASAVFGPQKGATPEMVQLLDSRLHHFADVIEHTIGVSLHHVVGAGAAGGAGGAFFAFFPGKLKPGIDVVLEAVSFREHSQDADLILTGEGKSDVQTLSGKVPFGISKAVAEMKKPVILISGCVDTEGRTILDPYFQEIYSLVGPTVTTKQAISDAARLLQDKTKHVIESYLLSKNY